MTTYYTARTDRYDAAAHSDDPTLRRPATALAYPTAYVTPAVATARPSRSGWIVSGLAALLAASALAVVGNLAIEQFTSTDSSVTIASAAPSAPAMMAAPAPIPSSAVAAPAVTVVPTLSAHRSSAPRVVVVTVPAPSPAASARVAAPPTPASPSTPKPLPHNMSGGVGTCDLIKCDPAPRPRD